MWANVKTKFKKFTFFHINFVDFNEIIRNKFFNGKIFVDDDENVYNFLTLNTVYIFQFSLLVK